MGIEEQVLYLTRQQAMADGKAAAMVDGKAEGKAEIVASLIEKMG